MTADFFYMILAGTGMIFITAYIFYEILYFAWDYLPKLPIKPRSRVFLSVIAAFAGHTICVWLYAFLFWYLVNYTGFGSFAGEYDNSLQTIIYFSLSTYSSLGYGDVYPQGAIRILAGMEVINGLVMIGWTASFTYLTMERYWPLRSQNKKK